MEHQDLGWRMAQDVHDNEAIHLKIQFTQARQASGQAGKRSIYLEAVELAHCDSSLVPLYSSYALRTRGWIQMVHAHYPNVAPLWKILRERPLRKLSSAPPCLFPHASCLMWQVGRAATAAEIIGRGMEHLRGTWSKSAVGRNERLWGGTRADNGRERM